jgi:hypothetical protein
VKLFRLLAVGALILNAGTVNAQEQLPADSMELGRKYTLWFYNGMADSLLAHMDSANRAAMTIAEIEQAMAQVATRAGNEVAVLEEKFITRNGRRQYWRTTKMDILEEPFLLRWVISPKGEIAGVGMGPLSGAPPIDPPKN